jgi:hypothetical protein
MGPPVEPSWYGMCFLIWKIQVANSKTKYIVGVFPLTSTVFCVAVSVHSVIEHKDPACKEVARLWLLGQNFLGPEADLVSVVLVWKVAGDGILIKH